MSIPVLILGDPGTGKTSSLRNFQDGEICVFQTIKKPLPFRTNIKTAATLSFDKMMHWLDAEKNYNAVFVDDFGYLITDMFVHDALDANTAKRDQYGVYKVLASKVYKLITQLMNDGRDNRIVYIAMHIERDSMGNIEPATIGKLLNEKIKLMGMVTIMLKSECIAGEYRFITNGAPFKSPPGMFEEEIENDLKAVDSVIREYWGIHG